MTTDSTALAVRGLSARYGGAHTALTSIDAADLRGGRTDEWMTSRSDVQSKVAAHRPDAEVAGALASLRAFNYERIYTRPDSVAQSNAVIEVLRGLVEYYCENPGAMPQDYHAPAEADRVKTAVTYVGGMTDRFAFDLAEELLGWDHDRLPQGIGRGV